MSRSDLAPVDYDDGDVFCISGQFILIVLNALMFVHMCRCMHMVIIYAYAGESIQDYGRLCCNRFLFPDKSLQVQGLSL